MYMFKKKYTLKKKINKLKGGTETKKGKKASEIRRTKKERNEDFIRVLNKTYNRLKSYRKEESGSKRKLDITHDIDILTAMNTANNATLKGGKKKKTKKIRKIRKKKYKN